MPCVWHSLYLSCTAWPHHRVQELALLKRLKGIGDGSVDIFFREAQLVNHAVFATVLLL